MAHPEVARGIEQGLIHAPVSWLTAAEGQPDGTAKRHHARIMIRFEEVWPNIPAGRCKYRSYAS